MSDILVRYRCDGCYRWTDDPSKWYRVNVKPFNSKGDLPERVDLYCPVCFNDNEGVSVGFAPLPYPNYSIMGKK